MMSDMKTEKLVNLQPVEPKKKRAPRVKKQPEPVQVATAPRRTRLVKGSQEAIDYMRKLREIKKLKQEVKI